MVVLETINIVSSFDLGEREPEVSGGTTVRPVMQIDGCLFGLDLGRRNLLANGVKKGHIKSERDWRFIRLFLTQPDVVHSHETIEALLYPPDSSPRPAMPIETENRQRVERMRRKLALVHPLLPAYFQSVRDEGYIFVRDPARNPNTASQRAGFDGTDPKQQAWFFQVVKDSGSALWYDGARRTAINQDGELFTVPPLMNKLLCQLFGHPGEVLTYEQLGVDIYPDERHLTRAELSHRFHPSVSAIRSLLDSVGPGWSETIQTVRGVGLVFTEESGGYESASKGGGYGGWPRYE